MRWACFRAGSVQQHWLGCAGSLGAGSLVGEGVEVVGWRVGFGFPGWEVGVGRRWWSEFVGAVWVSVYGPAVVVDVVVAAGADQYEVVNVGGPAFVPFVDVVGFAPNR